jgi:cyclohexa-1,5-dienecarbonyl-CoA hydratase
MEKVVLDYSHQGAVANILLNDGKGNVIDNIMMRELLKIFDQFRSNKDIKLIVFQGEGKHFSFGASVSEHTKEQAENMISAFHQLFVRLVELKIPTLSKISGQCLGGGMELAIFSNFIFADTTAVFGQPEIALGVIAPPASLILPLKIGSARAEDLLLTGRLFKAEEGKEIGLINEVFSDKESMNENVDQWISKHILPKSASSLKYAVKCARTMFNHVLLNKLPELELIYINQLMETKDANEGINAFIDKREPIWENC